MPLPDRIATSNISLPPCEPNDGGFVQLIAAIGLATIGGIITIAVSDAIANSYDRGALERLVSTDAASRSGFIQLESSIDDPTHALDREALKLPTAVDLGLGYQSRLSIEPVSGKIDVLRAPPEVIARYLESEGADQQIVVSLKDKLKESVTQDDPYTLLDDITIALRGSPYIRRDMTDYGASTIDPRFATSRVLAAIPDLSPTTLAALSGQNISSPDIARMSHYLSLGQSTRFDLVVSQTWNKSASSERRLPIEITAAGRVLLLGGPSS